MSNDFLLIFFGFSVFFVLVFTRYCGSKLNQYGTWNKDWNREIIWKKCPFRYDPDQRFRDPDPKLITYRGATFGIQFILRYYHDHGVRFSFLFVLNSNFTFQSFNLSLIFLQAEVGWAEPIDQACNWSLMLRTLGLRTLPWTSEAHRSVSCRIGFWEHLVT